MQSNRSREASKISRRSFCKWKSKLIWVSRTKNGLELIPLERSRPDGKESIPATCVRLRSGNDPTEGKWTGAVVRWRSRNAAALVPARCCGVDRFEIWLRCWSLRCVYGPREWTSNAILRGSNARYSQQGSHDDRRHREERVASGPEGLDANQCAAMRLLPGGTNHAGGGSIEQQKEADRPRD